jgi:thiol:disulfide interchange protein
MPPAEPSPISGPSRPLPRTLLLLAAALLVARVATGVWEHMRPPQGVDRVAWVEIDRAVEESRRTHKPILYEFGADWCGPCQIMANEVFADEANARRIEQSFVPVRVIDRQREQGRNPPDVDRLQNAYRISAFPTLVVARPDDPSFKSISGYRGRDATMSWLQGAARGQRIQMRFPDGPGGPGDSAGQTP